MDIGVADEEIGTPEMVVEAMIVTGPAIVPL